VASGSANVILTLGARQASDFGDVFPVHDFRRCSLCDATAGREEADAGAFGFLADLTMAGDEVELTAGEAEGGRGRGCTECDGDVLDAHFDAL
jgi:hypothetical protein